MKDDHDNVTIDLLEHHSLASEPAIQGSKALQLPAEPERRGRGRPAKHTSNADKQKAYRERLKAAGFKEIRKQVKVAQDETEP